MNMNGKSYLFRVSVAPADVWSRFYGKKLKPFYVISNSTKSAKAYAEKHLEDGLAIKGISKLAEQYGGNIFGSNYGT